MRCAICHSEFDPANSSAPPFCSERCRTIDLGRWLGEQYSVPMIADPDDEELAEPLPGEANPPASHT